jgi:hypothetical protein
LSDRSKRDDAKGRSSRTASRRAGRDSGDRANKSSVRLSGSNIGRVLRTAYDDALREPVPDDFLNLLGKLD